MDMLKRKQAGLPVKAEAPQPSPRNVVNLMDALRRSSETERKPPAQTNRQETLPRRTEQSATASR
jgi:non-homologous end joining protein Ku